MQECFNSRSEDAESRVRSFQRPQIGCKNTLALPLTSELGLPGLQQRPKAAIFPPQAPQAQPGSWASHLLRAARHMAHRSTSCSHAAARASRVASSPKSVSTPAARHCLQHALQSSQSGSAATAAAHASARIVVSSSKTDRFHAARYLRVRRHSSVPSAAHRWHGGHP